MSENILLIRIKAIGDVLLTLPAVAAVRQNFPDAKITFLTSQENISLLRGFVDVDEVIALDRAVLRSNNPLRVLPHFFNLLRRLRTERFDRVVDFQGNGESAWLTRITGAPIRCGTVYNPGQGWAYTRRVGRSSKIHPAEGNLELLRQSGFTIGAPKNEFVLPADAMLAAEKFFTSNGLNPGGNTLFLQPFTSSPHKNWPLENFIELARQWQTQGGQVIFWGWPGRPSGFAAGRECRLHCFRRRAASCYGRITKTFHTGRRWRYGCNASGGCPGATGDNADARARNRQPVSFWPAWVGDHSGKNHADVGNFPRHRPDCLRSRDQCKIRQCFLLKLLASFNGTMRGRFVPQVSSR